MRMTLTGKPTRISREQLRSYATASLAVLAYHNLYPLRGSVSIRVLKRLKYMGWHCGGVVKLRADLDAEEMLTTVLHELVHACVEFPAGTVEKCTSTLCAKLKPDVGRIAQVLLDGTYRRAAYVAHTKLAYRNREREDWYDGAEDEAVGIKSRYGRK